MTGDTERMNSSWKEGSHPGRAENCTITSNPLSPATAWQYQQTPIKTEPMDDTNMAYIQQRCQYISLSQNATFHTPGTSNVSPNYNANPGFPNVYNNILPPTPPEDKAPSSPPAMTSTPNSIKQEQTPEDESWRNQNWSPHSSSDSRSSNELDNLQALVQRKTSSPEEMISSPRAGPSPMDDLETSQPKVNSNGKRKAYKCKSCSNMASSKDEFWDHQRTHLKPDKTLNCHLCRFCTEFKHHLEYHIANHYGTKPFKCDKCDYRCVNKSMLASHAKCHSDIHQYRCANCTYSTKYCHSLKLHLRKYRHEPAKVLNADGTENPYPIIDVYGTRRGPKMKQQQQQQMPQQSQQPQPLVPAALPSSPRLQFPPQMMLSTAQFLPYVATLPPLIQNSIFQNIMQERAQMILAQSQAQNTTRETSPIQTDTGALDLSKSVSPPADPGSKASRNRRKGPAYRRGTVPDDSSDEEATTMFSNVEVVQNEDANSRDFDDNSCEQREHTVIQRTTNDANNNSRDNKNEYKCQHCGITYNTEVLYTIHMGFHGFKDPFTCNVCGQRFEDLVQFNLHILKPRDQHHNC